MNKKIIFQKCNFNNIYFLFYIITFFIFQLINYQMNKESENIPDLINYNLSSQILNLYLKIISDFIAVIPFFIRKQLLKKKDITIKNINVEDNKLTEDSALIYNDNIQSEFKKKKNKIILICIFIGILDFLHIFTYALYEIIYPAQKAEYYTFSCFVPFEIILQFICSYFILKIHFYKLQYLSLFLNLGIFIIILVIDLLNILIKNSFDGKIYYFEAMSIIFYSIEYSIGKKILFYGFISIYTLIIFKGIIKLIITLIFSLIFYYKNNDIFLEIKLLLTNSKFILLIIPEIFINFFLNLFIWLIIDKFSPNYFPFALIFREICYSILDKIYSSKSHDTMGWDIYLRIFLYVISGIGVMIHNEIVVINICNLGSDTKYFLDLEVKREDLFMSTDDPDIIKKFETEMEDENEAN